MEPSREIHELDGIASSEPEICDLDGTATSARETRELDGIELFEHEPDEGCIRPSNDVYCFLAGDSRANEQTVRKPPIRRYFGLYLL